MLVTHTGNRTQINISFGCERVLKVLCLAGPEMFLSMYHRGLEDIAEKLKTGYISNINETLWLNRETAKDVKPYFL